MTEMNDFHKNMNQNNQFCNPFNDKYMDLRENIEDMIEDNDTKDNDVEDNDMKINVEDNELNSDSDIDIPIITNDEMYKSLNVNRSEQNLNEIKSSDYLNNMSNTLNNFNIDLNEKHNSVTMYDSDDYNDLRITERKNSNNIENFSNLNNFIEQKHYNTRSSSINNIYFNNIYNMNTRNINIPQCKFTRKTVEMKWKICI
jgi:hypothetical protein